MSASSREYDVVVFGITSTVGMEIYKLMATKYINTKWAIAGRRQKPLEKIAADAGALNTGPTTNMSPNTVPSSVRRIPIAAANANATTANANATTADAANAVATFANANTNANTDATTAVLSTNLLSPTPQHASPAAMHPM